MKTIHLNGAEMLDKASTHAYLKKKFALPDHYGENLDALWDCLSTDFSAKKIMIDRPESIVKNMGAYGESLLALFHDIAAENHSIEVHLHETGGTKK